MKRNFFFVFAVILFASQQIFAVPAYPDLVTYTLPDGTEITIQLRGDEWVNWAETPDGFTLLFSDNGFLEYAVQDEQGDLQLSGIRAHNELQRTVEERIFLMMQPQRLRFSESQVETILELKGHQEDFLNRQQSVFRDEDGIQKSPFVGTFRMPIILVGFQNRPFTRTSDEIRMLFNNLNYTAGGLTGSVRDYFLAISHGQFNLVVDVFGPFTLPGNVINYTDNYIVGNSGPTCGGDPRTMARLAVDSAFLRGSANFADYDPFNTGVVVPHIIFAGHGTEAGAPRCESIWSHKWTFSPERVYNGKRISVYSCSPEFRGNLGSELGHIGVVAHEIGHSLLGLPDFYDTRSTGQVHLADWCLMASGSWGGRPENPGMTPTNISAWGRVDVGWVPEITLQSPENITLPNPAVQDVVYRINTQTNNEYFLIENRQKTGWDTHIPADGMLIYHVDRTNLAVWNANNVNALSGGNTRRRNYIKQAGGDVTSTSTDRTTDTWPQSGRTEFTDNSTPDSKSWAAATTDKPITDITGDAVARTVSFKFMDGANIIAPDTVPFFEGFENTSISDLPFGWIHSSGTTVWRVSGSITENIEKPVNPRTGTRQMTKRQNSNGNAWAFSRGIQMRAGTTYEVSFWYQAPGWAILNLYDNFKVQIGASRNIIGTGLNARMAGDTILLVNNQRTGEWTQVTYQFKPTTTGVYYLGFHDITPTGQGSIIAIDDISIEAIPIYNIVLSETETYTFPAADINYTEQTPLSVAITNDGNQPTGALNIALSGTNANNFVLSETSVVNIAVDNTDNFTVAPKIELAAGVYTATVTISGENDILQNFNVSFTVNEISSIADFTENDNQKLYPNPVQDVLYIETDEVIKHIEIITQSGQIVRTIEGNVNTIHVSNLPSGIYVIKITSDRGVSTKRIVKN
jgi:M6 family metalloprotease-like protein